MPNLILWKWHWSKLGSFTRVTADLCTSNFHFFLLYIANSENPIFLTNSQKILGAQNHRLRKLEMSSLKSKSDGWKTYGHFFLWTPESEIFLFLWAWENFFPSMENEARRWFIFTVHIEFEKKKAFMPQATKLWEKEKTDNDKCFCFVQSAKFCYGAKFNFVKMASGGIGLLYSCCCTSVDK